MSREISKQVGGSHRDLRSPCVFLVDHDPVTSRVAAEQLRRAGLRVHACDSPQTLLSTLSTDARGCVVVGVTLSWGQRRRLQQALLDREIVLPLIFTTDDADVLHALAIVQQGRAEVLPTPSEPIDLFATIERAFEADAALVEQRQTSALAQARWQTLSPREQQVCRLFAEGLLNKQIAAELGTGESTVQAQRARALAKLGVSSVVEVQRLLVRAGEHE